MKKRLISLGLSSVMALALAIPVGAVNATPTPEELYQEYLSVAAEINAECGTDISVIPLEEMDINNMPDIEEVAADVRELAMMKVTMIESAEDEIIFPITNMRGIGTNNVERHIAGVWLSQSFSFMASAKIVVTSPTGTPNCYIQSYSNAVVGPYGVPTGYSLTPQESTLITLSSDKKSLTLHRSYTVTKGTANSEFHPTAKFTVNSSTGAITSSTIRI